MSKPKILYIGRSLPCRTETFVFNEIFELKRQGWEVETASVHAPERGLGDSKLDKLSEESLQIYSKGIFRFFKEMIFYPIQTFRTLFRSFFTGIQSPLTWKVRLKIVLQSMAALSIAEELRKRHIEHIHAHMAHVPTTMAWVLAYQLNLPFSFTGHAADIFRDNVLLKEKLQVTHFCVCISQWHRHFYQTIYPIPDRRLPVIYCGIHLENIQSAKPEKGLILSVGRLVPKKGYLYLLDALNILKIRGVDFQCRVIGEGSERASLEEKIQTLDLENHVILMGIKTHFEILEWVSRAQLFVLPCIKDVDGDRDGIPLVLMEAMASNVPVVAGDLPTVRELIIDGKNGLIVNPKKAEEIAEAMNYLIENHSFAEDLAKEGAKTIEGRFDLKKNVKKLGMMFKKKRVDLPSSSAGRKLLIISPCRNEAKYLERSIQSVLNQTVLPEKWVIVNDGSTDETSEILEKFAERNPFITVLHKENRGERRVGPGVIEAFNQGLESQNWQEHDYVCKLDLDLELPSDYFESLIEIMEMNPRIGTCSGKAYYRNKKGKLVSEKCSDDMSQGMTKLYRTKCFEEIGGFVQEVMWDGIDCHRCRMLGWQAASWDDPHLRFVHLRPMGSSQQGIITGRMRHGYGQYFMGTGVLYMLVSALYRMIFSPLIVGGVSMFLGYLNAWWRQIPRYKDLEFRKFLRSYQWSCLFRGKKRATALLDKNQEKLWLEKHSCD